MEPSSKKSKNGKSPTIVLSRALIDVLRAHRATQSERKLFASGYPDIAEGLAEIRAGLGEPWPKVRAELEAYFATLPEYDDDD